MLAVSLLAVCAAPWCSGAGVTIITHGFGSGTTDWVAEMEAAIVQRAVEGVPGGFCNLGKLTVYDSNGILPGGLQVSVSSWALNLSRSPIAEIIIALDWSDVDGAGFDFERHSTTEVADAVAHYVTDGLVRLVDTNVIVFLIPFFLAGRTVSPAEHINNRLLACPTLIAKPELNYSVSEDQDVRGPTMIEIYYAGRETSSSGTLGTD